jgi:O-antigen/teichoic acid export membrane protein
MMDNLSFQKNVSIVSLGPIISTVVAFLAEPWIARFWEPSVYGVVTYYNSIILIVSPLMFLRYNFAIVQAKTDKEAYNLMALSLIIMVVMISILLVFFEQFDSLAGNLISLNSIGSTFIAVIAIASGTLLIRFWYNRKSKFLLLSLTTIILQSSFTILLLVVGKFGKTDESNIILIRNISYILAPSVIFFVFLKVDALTFIRNISIKGMLHVLKLYKKFPVYEFWGYGSAILAFNIAIILITKYWGQTINGLFSKAFFLLYLFIIFLGESINRVLHKEVSDMVNRGEDPSGFLMKLVSSLAMISVLPFVFVLASGPELFSVVLGERWYDSGVFAQFLSIWMYMLLISTSIRSLYGVLNKQLQSTLFMFLTLITRSGILIYAGVKQFDVFYTVLVFSIVSFVISLFRTSYIVSVAGGSGKKVFKEIVIVILQVIPLIASVWLARQFVTDNPFIILGVTAILCLPYLYYYLKKSSILLIIFKKK